MTVQRENQLEWKTDYAFVSVHHVSLEKSPNEQEVVNVAGHT